MKSSEWKWSSVFSFCSRCCFFRCFFCVCVGKRFFVKTELSFMNDNCEWMWQNLCEFATQKTHSNEKQPELELSLWKCVLFCRVEFWSKSMRKRDAFRQTSRINSEKLEVIHTSRPRSIHLACQFVSFILVVWAISIRCKAYFVAFFELTSHSLRSPEFGSLCGSEYGRKKKRQRITD